MEPPLVTGGEAVTTRIPSQLIGPPAPMQAQKAMLHCKQNAGHILPDP
jgi:hypothetical protein